MEDLHRHGAEALVARLCPAVVGVAEVLEEERDAHLIAAHGRVRPAGGDEMGGPVLCVSRRPTPGVLVRERGEAANGVFARLDRRGSEQPRALLDRPAVEHRVEDGVFRVEDVHARYEEGRHRFECARPMVARRCGRPLHDDEGILH